MLKANTSASANIPPPAGAAHSPKPPSASPTAPSNGPSAPKSNSTTHRPSGNQTATRPSPYANYTSWYLNKRPAIDNLQLYKRTNLKATNATPATLSPKPALNLFMFARNNAGIADQLWNSTLRFASIGSAMTTQQVADYYTAIQTLQQSLGRTV